VSVPADWRTTARDGLVVLLTVTTGAVDAASFLYLGHVFCSVITGTLVLLGISVGTHDPGLALNCGVALVSYIVGVVAGTPVAVRRAGRWLEGWPVRRWHRATKHHEIWPSWLTVALAVEFCLLALFSLGWELTSGRPSGVAQRLLLAAAGVGMGIQAASIRQLGEVSTTYLTGTLTGLISALATGRTPEGLRRSLGIFAALVTGAILSALITMYQPALLPIVVLAPIALVVWLASARFGPRPAAADQASQDSQDSPS
jgi:uncharacterized membrane protein YoaK (UPF0700 family)